ncbi:hypothetical protein SAMN05216299_105114 [Nitrosospira sp. Nsp14]|nr:hypothetical protein SAMN05216299_105114 [Nitrosospira sp. Nsp14]
MQTHLFSSPPLLICRWKSGHGDTGWISAAAAYCTTDEPILRDARHSTCRLGYSPTNNKCVVGLPYGSGVACYVPSRDGAQYLPLEGGSFHRFHGKTAVNVAEPPK